MNLAANQQQLPSTNCSNNSTEVSSIDDSAQSYLAAEKPPIRFHQSISQPATPQFNLRANLRLDSEATNSPISFKTDTDLLNQFSTDDLVYRIKSLETKNRKLLFENGCLVRDLNSNLANVQYCKQEMSQLRELCCWLDDERTKARITATEWAFKLKKEINSYSHKLGELENKQFELIRENYELKQLCLLMDKAMTNKVNESETDKQEDKNANDQLNDCEVTNEDRKGDCKSDCKERFKEVTGEPVKHRSLINSKVMRYIRQLEIKLEQCEEQRRMTLSLFKDRNVPLEEPIRELEKFRLKLEELKDQRPEEIERGMQVFLVEQSLAPSLNVADDVQCGSSERIGQSTSQAEDSQSTFLGESRPDLIDCSPEDEKIGEDQRSIIKQLCGAAYKKIESE